MGQTLSHGVYLPAEGERNCYSGLASNWNLLDTALGDIDGKASATHTHGNITNDGKVGTTANLPLITGTGGVVQAGSFGNSANTFCEGNDSRLSDARTPVAHTHTKSDVTDLLNSNFIPSANNSYDVGSSSYQWNNLYAKNYFYNGVAWGLDKANTWSNDQIIASSNDKCYFVKDTVYELGQSYSSGEHLGGLSIQDKNGSIVGLLDIVDRSYGNMEMRIRVQQKFDPDSNNRSTSGTILFNELTLGIGTDKTNYISFNADLWGANRNLGTSSFKWKTLNGINPGALSLPDTLGTSGTENVNYFNVIGYLNNTGTLATIPSTATYDGWLYINAKDGTDSYIIIDDSPASFGTSVFGNNGLGAQGIGLLCLICPIRKGHSYNVRIKSAGIVSARIYPAQGNV